MIYLLFNSISCIFVASHGLILYFNLIPYFMKKITILIVAVIALCFTACSMDWIVGAGSEAVGSAFICLK